MFGFEIDNLIIAAVVGHLAADKPKARDARNAMSVCSASLVMTALGP